MTVFAIWTGRAAFSAALALVPAVLTAPLGGTAHAETVLSQSNDPTAPLDAQLTALLGQEHAALGSVGGARLQAIVTPPQTQAKGKAPVATISYDTAWLAAQPAPSGDAEFECLAKALYFEARGETMTGQAAVGEVVLNRTESPAYPRSICGVVGQSSEGGCQFSFVCDGQSDAIGNSDAWMTAAKIARALIDGAPRSLTEGATHFHANAVNPSWARRFTLTARIGAHVFYRDGSMRTASN